MTERRETLVQRLCMCIAVLMIYSMCTKHRVVAVQQCDRYHFHSAMKTKVDVV